MMTFALCVFSKHTTVYELRISDWSSDVCSADLQAYGLTSPRRVEALIARLVQVGYLRTEAAPGDRRARLLVPCAPMIEHDREWLALHYAPLAVLLPDDPAYHRPRSEEHPPELQSLMRISSAGFCLKKQINLKR